MPRMSSPRITVVLRSAFLKPAMNSARENVRLTESRSRAASAARAVQ